MKETFSNPTDLETDRSVVSHNLLTMEREMPLLRRREVMGRITETIDGEVYPCQVLRGYAERETGRISIFKNTQNIPQGVLSQDIQFSFQLAVNPNVGVPGTRRNTKESKIVVFIGANRFSKRAIKNIDESTAEYNARHWPRDDMDVAGNLASLIRSIGLNKKDPNWRIYIKNHIIEAKRLLDSRAIKDMEARKILEEEIARCKKDGEYEE